MDSIKPTLTPDAVAMATQLEHLFGGHLDGLADGLIELAWQDGNDGALRHAGGECGSGNQRYGLFGIHIVD